MVHAHPYVDVIICQLRASTLECATSHAGSCQGQAGRAMRQRASRTFVQFLQLPLALVSKCHEQTEFLLRAWLRAFPDSRICVEPKLIGCAQLRGSHFEAWRLPWLAARRPILACLYCIARPPPLRPRHWCPWRKYCGGYFGHLFESDLGLGAPAVRSGG